MSPEQITQWAKEAGGCQLADYDCAFALNLGSLTRFAALIRDMTLEEAAWVCDEDAEWRDKQRETITNSDKTDDMLTCHALAAQSIAIDDVADKIRARKP